MNDSAEDIEDERTRIHTQEVSAGRDALGNVQVDGSHNDVNVTTHIYQNFRPEDLSIEPPEIVHYLIDRTQQCPVLDDMGNELRDQDNDTLICLIPGEMDEMHDGLATRFKFTYLNHLENFTTDRAPLRWPAAELSADQAFLELQSDLIKTMGGVGHQPEDLMQVISNYEVVVLCYNLLQDIDWQKTRDSALIQKWIDYWSARGADHSKTKVVLFFFFRYKNVERRWLNMFRKNQKKEMLRCIAEIEEKYPHVMVTETLQSIRKEHLLKWSTELCPKACQKAGQKVNGNQLYANLSELFEQKEERQMIHVYTRVLEITKKFISRA